MKNVLITAKNSYVGNSFFDYIHNKYNDCYNIDKISLREINIEELDLSNYDTIFHVAGIAHSDYGNISNERAKEYYKINTDLTIELAKKAKLQGVKQFIFMSSIIVYGESAPIGVKKIITKDTIPSPINAYGDSKLKAEDGLRNLEDTNFMIKIVRSPLIYGNYSKGNFKILRNIALKAPLFPYIINERSVISIDKLCECIKILVDNNESGIYFPQDEEYMNTSMMVKKIAKDNNKNIVLIKGFDWLFVLMSKFVPQINKAFGNLTYSKNLKYISFN